MADFERRSEKDADKVQGDPLLELTRLFGTHPRSAVPEQEGEADTLAPESTAQGNMLQDGISMAGSFSMGGYGINVVLPATPFPLPSEVSPDASPKQDSDVTEGAEICQPAALSCEEDVIETSTDLAGVRDWTNPDWEEMQLTPENVFYGDSAVNIEEERLWQPPGDGWGEDEPGQQAEDVSPLFAQGQGVGGALSTVNSPPSPMVSLSETSVADTVYDEQLFHALEGDLTVEMSAVTGSVGEIKDGSPDADVTGGDIAQNQPRKEAVQDDSVTPPRFTGNYFGYGQSVQLNVKVPLANPSSNPLSMARADLPVESTLHQSSPPQRLPAQSRPIPTAASPVRQSPPTVFAQPHSQTIPLPDPLPDFVPDFTDVVATEAFTETLHDFDLTIQKERRRRARPASSLSVQLEKTEPFELPPVNHDAPSPSLAENDFADDFAVRLKTADDADDDRFFSEPVFEPEQDQENVPESGLYDWAAPVQVAQPVPERGGIYIVLSVLLLIGAGIGGYLAYDFYLAGDKGAVVIKAGSGEIKFRPEVDTISQVPDTVTEVYNQTEIGDGQRQDELLDGSEPPLNVDLLEALTLTQSEDQTVFSGIDTASRADMDPVDESILRASSRAIPVHIVPTVTIRRDENGNVASIPNDDGREEIFMPANEYRKQIIQNLTQVNPAQGSAETGTGTQMTARAAGQNPGQFPVQEENEANQLEIPMTGLQTDGQMPVRMEVIPAEGLSVNAGNLALPSPPVIIPDKPDISSGQTSNGGSGAVNGSGAASSVQFATTTDTPFDARDTSINQPLDERFYVQIASQPSQQAAIDSVDEVKRRFASLIGDNQLVIVPANIPGRGIFYRVRILLSERADAVDLCQRYQAAGGNCFVGR